MASTSKKNMVRILVEPLTPASFSEFGTVVENPSRDPSSWPSIPESTMANQGTAKKYIDVSHMTNHYSVSPSRKPAQPLVSMFVCSPRPLSASLPEATTTLPYPGTTRTLNIPILERHPFTTQTFIPLGLDPQDRTTAFIVVVAPTLPLSSSASSREDRPPPYPSATTPAKRRRSGALTRIFRRARPEPFTNNYEPASKSTDPAPAAPYTTAAAAAAAPGIVVGPSTPAELRDGPTLLPSFSSLVQFRSRPTPLTHSLFRPRGPGGPDLSRARAFIAHGGQAVTYGPGTWHAPMAVVGRAEVSFVVTQWGNGVGVEDCQEVEIGEGALEVQVVEEGLFGARTGGGLRARL